jgi:uncharacterized protein (TIGR00661 family)
MRILYGIQATGNGHISRALEIGPILEQFGEVDYLLSGKQSEISINRPIKHRKYGGSFIFGKEGGVDVLKTFQSARPVRLLKDIIQLDTTPYDLVISDFEPISSWACRFQPEKLFSISHQAAFMSAACPRPVKVNPIAEFLLKNFAPSRQYIGLHFEPYGPNITTPIIRKDIREMSTAEEDFVCVYLPAFSAASLVEYFSKLTLTKWKVYCKEVTEVKTYNNVSLYPVGHPTWTAAFANAHAILVGAGFESPSEALALGKKLMVVPMKNQYEQQCNRAALTQLGVPSIDYINEESQNTVENWLKYGEIVKMEYPNHSYEIIKEVIDLRKKDNYAFAF